MIAVTFGGAALFVAAVIVFEVVLWALAQGIWKLGLWKNARNIRQRQERESAPTLDQHAATKSYVDKNSGEVE